VGTDIWGPFRSKTRKVGALNGMPPGAMALAADGGPVAGVRGRPAVAIGRLPDVEALPLWLGALALGSVAVVALDFVHPLDFPHPTFRAAAETVIASLAVAAIWLLRANFARTRRLRDLLLLAGLTVLALTEFWSYALPSVLNMRLGGGFAATLQCGELMAAATLAAAAATPPSRLIGPGRRPLVPVAILCGAAFITAQLGALLLRNQLVAFTARPVHGIGHALAHPLGLALAVGAAGLFILAAHSFLLTSGRENDRLITLLAGAAILLAAARLDPVAVSWSSPGWIGSREVLRLLAYALILDAAVRQDLRRRARAARGAAIAERRRVARDLHDGLAQDLAFIAAHSDQIGGGLGSEHPVSLAVRRALALSRGTISELTDWGSTSTHEALDSIAAELGDQFKIDIAVEVDQSAEPPSRTREQLARIAREAIANAARHGHADNVVVSLKCRDRGIALRVADDGCGIGGEDGGAPREGFGLRCVGERAAALGGYLTVRESKRGGTELEVVLP
jgi:signal transduction histidine kinase